MTDHSLEIVRFALALHLDVIPDAIDMGDDLARDLGLDPLDLVLVVLRLEEMAEAEFPVADLEHTKSVQDLVSLVRTWCEGAETDRPTLPTEIPSVRRHDSSVQLVASAASVRRAVNG